MRTIALLLGVLAIAGVARAATELDVIVLPKPTFPPPAADGSAGAGRLVLVSSRYRSPGALAPPLPEPPAWAPRSFRGAPLQFAIRQPRSVRLPGRTFLVYGRDGSSGRFLVSAEARTKKLRYGFDFVNLAQPPGGGWFEAVTWAREADGVLYVENTHLTYATATRRRNAYLTAISLDTRKILWRSPALVANARTFVLGGDFIVSGYGFTAEPDFLYLLDRRTGRVLDRLPVPSAPEIIKLRDGRLHVRAYDREIVARVAR